ncbi:hypothetical protein JCM3775_005215 [Rhodotorula graminis]|uniref:Ketoreductase (KR) domain-containing protein n=1 Tax=Rhodotorula graminis (strain WP1) TaxID=578459 RepID=A0A0N8PZG8_RHOGW|nr:uncharacterized protein RHOBADRAFT_65665 [Rhodotorula graminis WP1]KPV72285.1 hypothetical protein RHOBADRAFT_65665 [Rhodotorula graminis WP1]
MSTSYGPGSSYTQWDFIKGHLTARVPVPEANLDGRVALITGATSGLGFAAAQHFARLDTSLIIVAARNPAKAKTCIEQLYKDVPTFRGEVKTVSLDMTSFASVRACVKELEQFPRLDFALLNAGIANMKHVETDDGWLADIQVNVLSTGLLALLLLPKLQATAKLPQPTSSEPANLKPQLHIVASEVHYWVAPATEKLMLDADHTLKLVSTPEFRKKVPFSEIYQVTKLFDVYLARKIGALDSARGVQVTSSSPGLCKSSLLDTMGPILSRINYAIAWRSEFGTRTYMHGMLDPQPQGAFVFKGKAHPPSTFACSPDGVKLENKVWEEAREVWEEVAPEVKEVLGGL